MHAYIYLANLEKNEHTASCKVKHGFKEVWAGTMPEKVTRETKQNGNAA